MAYREREREMNANADDDDDVQITEQTTHIYPFHIYAWRSFKGFPTLFGGDCACIVWTRIVWNRKVSKIGRRYWSMAEEFHLYEMIWKTFFSAVFLLRSSFICFLTATNRKKTLCVPKKLKNLGFYANFFFFDHPIWMIINQNRCLISLCTGVDDMQYRHCCKFSVQIEHNIVIWWKGELKKEKFVMEFWNFEFWSKFLEK
jgi:hypothetical protein